MNTLERLKKHASKQPSLWREAAKTRQDDKEWLGYSQQIAMKMLDCMENQSITQQQLAERMECSQQYVSKILKGRENLSLETICKIERALDTGILSDIHREASIPIRKATKRMPRAAVL